MSHRRTLIRNKAVDILKNATAAAERVFPSRIGPLWQVQYPAILVYGRQESCQSISSSLTPSVRTLQLSIEIRASAEEGDMESTLDDIALEIENLIKANPKLGNNAMSINLQSTEIDLGTDLGNKPIGASRLTYEVVYEE